MNVWDVLKQTLGTLRMRFSGKTVSGGVAAAVIALASPFIIDWEGKRNFAYIPIPGDVPTICYGSTKGVKMGDYKSDVECVELLRQEVGEFYQRIAACVKPDVPVSVQASLLELAYNVGSSDVCNSTAMRKANAGDYDGACAELDRWVNSGGERVKGLVNRRNASQEMCERDLS